MIIKKLIKSGVCFSIMKSYSTLKGTISYRSSEYEIVTMMGELPEFEEHGFETNQNTTECAVNWLNPDGIISKIMNDQEVEEFQKYITQFVEVYNDPKTGKIFELKKNSLKEKYHQIN